MAGFETLRRQFNGLQSDASRGSVTFASGSGQDAITNLRLGLPSSAVFSIGNADRGYRGWDLTFYAGDRWRASRNLTVNYGLRFQPSPAPYEVNHFEPILYGCDCNNVAPQLGLAYRLPGSAGVLRAGYGLQYGSVLPVMYSSARFNPPANVVVVTQHPDLLNVLNVTGQPSASGRLSYINVSSDMASPYSHQYNFGWQREMARGWKLEVGYVGSRSFKLLQVRHNNRGLVAPGLTIAPETVDQRRPDPRYTLVTSFLNGSRGWFDAARATLTVPRWKGLNADLSYWFSKSLDYGANNADQGGAMVMSQSEYNLNKDLRGLSDFDQPHSLRARMVYDIPALRPRPRWVRALTSGWSVSTIALAKTGTPFLVSTGSDMPGYGNVDGSPGDRPNLLDPTILGRTIGNPDTSRRLLPKAAFSFIQLGAQQGSLGRNVFRKGPVQNLNAGVARRFAVWKEKRLTIRAESINALNSPQFAAPGFTLADPNFGAITNTLNDGRTFRFTGTLDF